MAEECVKCIMVDKLERMEKDIEKNEEHTNETEKVVYEIKESHTQTRFLMEQIQKNLDAQAIATEKRENANNLANIKNQDLVAQTSKENKATMDAGFKAIADKKIEEEKKAIENKEKADAEKQRQSERQDAKEEAMRKEKRDQTRAILMVFLVLALNTAYGLLKTYFPKFVGL